MAKKYSAKWWFGPNSVWQQSGLMEQVTGTRAEKKWEIPIGDSKVGLDNQTMMMVGVIAVLYFVTR